MAKTKNIAIFIAVVAFLAFLFFVLKGKSKKDGSDNTESLNEPINDSGGFDLYQSIKTFMDKQTAYVMGEL